MATESSVAITAGSGTPVDTVLLSGGDQQQVVRDAYANTAPTIVTWTVTTAGLSNVITADNTRVGLLITSLGSGRVWIRFDATIPTLTSYSTYIDPDDRMVIGPSLATRAVSLAGQIPGGTIFVTEVDTS